jgi:hypothetical protein
VLVNVNIRIPSLNIVVSVFRAAEYRRGVCAFDPGLAGFDFLAFKGFSSARDTNLKLDRKDHFLLCLSPTVAVVVITLPGAGLSV